MFKDHFARIQSKFDQLNSIIILTKKIWKNPNTLI